MSEYVQIISIDLFKRISTNIMQDHSIAQDLELILKELAHAACSYYLGCDDLEFRRQARAQYPILSCYLQQHWEGSLTVLNQRYAVKINNPHVALVWRLRFE